MRYVILRDDDTNALTPVECLERLYRPFLDRGLPVNLAVIPEVRADIRLPDGNHEGFLLAKTGEEPETLPIAGNPGLVAYLRTNAGYHVVQHGCHHDYLEFDRMDRAEVVRRMEHGARCLGEAGLGRGRDFLAPYDKFSPVSLAEAAERFDVVSSGWFELRRLPLAWWPRYAVKKLRGRSHWQAGQTRLLGHPGCLLSFHHPFESMLDEIRRAVENQTTTVLVTHWWEYFRNNEPDEAFIGVLHRTAEYLASQEDIRVVTFDDLADGRVPLR